MANGRIINTESVYHWRESRSWRAVECCRAQSLNARLVEGMVNACDQALLSSYPLVSHNTTRSCPFAECNKPDLECWQMWFKALAQSRRCVARPELFNPALAMMTTTVREKTIFCLYGSRASRVDLCYSTHLVLYHLL